MEAVMEQELTNSEYVAEPVKTEETHREPRRRGRRPKAFVRVATAPLVAADDTKSASKESALPDPSWMAEFVVALLGLR
jgi:hypothetical protein